MDFSETIPGVKSSVYSDDGKLIALSNGTKIIIKSPQDMSTLSVLQFKDVITTMKFSPDSTLILVLMSKSSLLEVYSVVDGKKICNILDESSGLINARWVPDSKSIIAFSDFQLKATIYSLTDKQTYHIKSPKYVSKGISFTNDGKFMALAERSEAKDFIGIYFTKDWKLINHFEVETRDLQDIAWSDDFTFILVWDTILEYKLVAYCPAKGKKAVISPYSQALGIKSVALSNNSTFAAVGSYDEKVRLINCLTWQIITELEHQPNLKSYTDSQPVIYDEQNVPLSQQTYNSGGSHYANPDNCKIDQLKVNYKQADQPLGIEKIIWSHDNQFIATKSTNMPKTIWIWDVTNLELKYVLNHLQPIKTFSWNKNSLVLVISTGQSKLFFFSLDGASVCELPFEGGKPFNVNKITWSPDSHTMILSDANQIIVGYPPNYLTGIENDNNTQQN